MASAPAGVDCRRLKFAEGDACDLSAELGPFDAVLASNLLCRLPRPAAFLASLPRLVAPGGIAVLVSPYSWMEVPLLPTALPPLPPPTHLSSPSLRNQLLRPAPLAQFFRRRSPHFQRNHSHFSPLLPFIARRNAHPRSAPPYMHKHLQPPATAPPRALLCIRAAFACAPAAAISAKSRLKRHIRLGRSTPLRASGSAAASATAKK